MAIYHTVYAVCDGMGCNSRLTLRHKKHKLHVAQLRAKGWSYRHGECYCPFCAAAKEKEWAAERKRIQKALRGGV